MVAAVKSYLSGVIDVCVWLHPLVAGVARAIEVMEELVEAQLLWKSQGGPAGTVGFWDGVLAANADEDAQSRQWW